MESSMWQMRGDTARAAQASGEALGLQPTDLGYLRDYLLLLLESGQTAQAQSAAENYGRRPYAVALTKAIRARIVAPQDEQQAETWPPDSSPAWLRPATERWRFLISTCS